jgi:fucose permease
MAELPHGEGERIESASRRKRILVLGILFCVGLATGFYAGFRDAVAVFERGGSWPPAMALALLALFVVAMVAGTWVMSQVMDELDRQRSYKAASFGAVVLLTGYPAWFLLWKGGFVAEPSHWLIYLVFLVAMALASLWYRLR